MINPDLFKVDPNKRLPLYHQIVSNLRDLIILGHLKPGDCLPGEWDLAQIYAVSRLTIRRALDDLVRQTWLEKKHGVGTFVRQPTMVSMAASKLSFTELIQAMGQSPSSRLIKQQVIKASTRIARTLQIKQNQPVFELTRIRRVKKSPIFLETSCLPLTRFPKLDGQDWSKDLSLYKILLEEYGVIIHKASLAIKPVLLTQEEAILLRSKTGIPSIFSETVAFTREGTPVEYSYSFSNGNRSDFYFHFQYTIQDNEIGGADTIKNWN